MADPTTAPELADEHGMRRTTSAEWLRPGALAWWRYAEERRPVVVVRPHPQHSPWWHVLQGDDGSYCAVHERYLSPRPAEPAPEEMAKRAPLPPDSLVGAVHDRIHETSGRLLASMPIRRPEPAPEPVWPDGERARDAALDLCVLCGVPLADESDVEDGYVTAFARDPADPTRCLSHGRTNLGGGR